MPEEFLSANSSIKDPVVIDPPEYDVAAAWKGCQDYVERCGGLAYPDGEPNICAAAGADPGCASCPNCHQYFWAFGKRIQCTECGFEFETDWWPMYSSGVSDGQIMRGERTYPDQEFTERLKYGITQRIETRMAHPYYRYGYGHPTPSPWEQHDKLPWREIMTEEA